MACLRVRGPLGERLLPEGDDGNVRGMWPEEVIIRGELDCSPRAFNEMNKWWTEHGLMVGNVVKSITTKLRIPHCLSCAGRQRQLNAAGITVQEKVKEFFS